MAWQRGVAVQNEERARAERNAALASEVNRIAGIAKPYLVSGRPDIALALALDVAPRSPEDEAPLSRELELVLRRAFELTPAPVERRAVDNAYRVAASADGRWIAVGTAGNQKGVVQIFSAASMTEHARFQAMDDNVLGLEFSPDSSSLAVAGGKTPAVWDVVSGQKRFSLALPEDLRAFTKLARFSPDGSYVVVSTTGNQALVYDADNGELKHVLPGMDFLDMVDRIGGADDYDPVKLSVLGAQWSMFGTTTDIAISPDSSMIAVTGPANLDGAVQIFDARTGDLSKLLTGGIATSAIPPMSYADNIAFSPDGKSLFASPIPKSIKAWTIEDGALRAESPARDIHTFIVSTDGRALISGHTNGSLVIRCMEGLLEAVTLPAHSGTVESITADHGRKLMISTSADGTAKLWRLPASDEICLDDSFHLTADRLAAMRPLWVLAGHRSPVFDAAFSPDGKSVHTVSQDAALRSWRMPRSSSQADGTEFASWNRPDRDELGQLIVVSRDGSKVFVSGDTYQEFVAFEVETGSVEKLPGVKAVAAEGPDGRPRLFATVDQYWAYGEGRPPLKNDRSNYQPWQGTVSSDGRYAVRTEPIVGSFLDGYPVLVDVESGKDIRRLEAMGRTAYEFKHRFSPDGSLLFAAFESVDSNDGDGLAVWDASTGLQRGSLPAIEGYSMFFKHHFSADGRIFMLENGSREAKVFQLAESAIEPVAVTGLAQNSAARALASDGSIVFEAREDGTVAVLPVGGGANPATTLRVSETPLTFVTAFSDISHLAVTDIGNTLTVISLADGSVLHSLQLMAEVFDVRFLPDGDSVFIADVDGRLMTIPLVPGSGVSRDATTFVEWLRAKRHSVVTVEDRALFGLTGPERKKRPDLDAIPPFPVPPKRANPSPNEQVTQCDALAANPFDQDRRAPGVAFDLLDAAAAFPVCRQALEASPDDPQTRYQMARLHDKLSEIQAALDGYMTAAEQGYAVAMRGISRLILLDQKGEYKHLGSAREWRDRAARAGDPWSLAPMATEAFVETEVEQGIGPALSMLFAAGVINNSQVAMTLASRVYHHSNDPETRQKAHIIALLAMELFDTLEDPAPFADYALLNWTHDFVRDQGHLIEPGELVRLYQRARDWRAQ